MYTYTHVIHCIFTHIYLCIQIDKYIYIPHTKKPKMVSPGTKRLGNISTYACTYKCIYTHIHIYIDIYIYTCI